MLLLSVIGGILFFLLYCCLVVGKRSDRKLADYEDINANIRMYRNDHLKMYKITL